MSPEERRADLDRQRQALRDAIAARRWYTQSVASDMARTFAWGGHVRVTREDLGMDALLEPEPDQDGVYVVTSLE